MESKKGKSKIIIHTCCAVCGAYLAEFFKENSEPILFFYNPNIYPLEEYERRKDAIKKLAEIYNLKFIEGDYDTENWNAAIKGFEAEPEGGKRCEICFKMRLDKTAEFAKENDADFFATTLAISPYKNEKIINEIGESIGEKINIKFVKLTELNIDKKELWQKTRELAKKYNFYHQNYCGCIFSINKKK